MVRNTAICAIVPLCLLSLVGCGDSNDDEGVATTTTTTTTDVTDDTVLEGSDDSEEPDHEAPVSLDGAEPCELFTAADAAVAMAVPEAAIPTGDPLEVSFFVGPDRCGYQPADAVEINGSRAAVMVLGGIEIADALAGVTAPTEGVSPYSAAGFDGYLITGDDSGSTVVVIVGQGQAITFIVDLQGEDGSADQVEAVADLAETVLARL